MYVRLDFTNVHAQPERKAYIVAAGEAVEKPTGKSNQRRSHAWATGVVDNNYKSLRMGSRRFAAENFVTGQMGAVVSVQNWCARFDRRRRNAAEEIAAVWHYLALGVHLSAVAVSMAEKMAVLRLSIMTQEKMNRSLLDVKLQRARRFDPLYGDARAVNAGPALLSGHRRKMRTNSSTKSSAKRCASWQ